MGRSPPLAAEAVILLVLLLPAPLVLSASSSKAGVGAGAARIGRFAVSPKRFLKILPDFVKIAAEALSRWSNGQETNGKGVVESSADTAGLFIFNLTIGTSSPQNISGFLDITTPLVWSQCSPCNVCLPAPAPTFEPNQSPTFTRLRCSSQTCQRVLNPTCSTDDGPCRYTGFYGDKANTTGDLATDTFTFGTPVPGLVFGCSDTSFGDYSGASGVFGFSRGPLSLVSQLQLSWFSYLFASDDSGGAGLFQFGGDDVTTTTSSRSTPLLTSSLYPELYFVKLTGIMVDGHPVGIPAGTFDIQANGSGGVLLSTTVPVTFLEEAAYSVVLKAIASRIRQQGPQPVNGSALGLDLCYSQQALANVTVPKLALVFQGANAVMELKRYNYFFADNTTGLDCLAILKSPLPFSVLGSLLQTGTTMTYDIADAQLIFESATAQTSAAALVSLMMVQLLLALWVLLF